MIATPVEFLKNNDFVLVFQQLWNHDIENLNISWDVWQKSTATWMELFKNIENPCGFLWFWNRDIENLNIPLGVCKKMERGTDGVIEK